jgi:hypothetical protein
MRVAIVAVVGLAVLAAGGGRAAAATERESEPGTSASLFTLVVSDVGVHRGGEAVIGYLVDDVNGGTVAVDLVVTTPAG